MRMSSSVYLEIVSNDWIFLKIIKFPKNVTVFTFPVLVFHTSNADKYERKKHCYRSKVKVVTVWAYMDDETQANRFYSATELQSGGKKGEAITSQSAAE